MALGPVRTPLTGSALDPVHLRHSIRFPTLCTLMIGGQAVSPESFPPPPDSNPCEWRLPTNDPRDEGNDLHRIHTVDIYFWTLNDANSFLDSVERVLSKSHIESDRHYAPSGSDNAMSTVVQQLEDVAVTDPAYQDGHTRNSRTEPVPSTAPQNVTATSALPPPPPGGPPPTAQPATGAQPDAEQKQDAANPAPLPYNPAAPAAPEPIQHREKTPPPVDADNGTGLAEAAVADHNIQHQHAQQAPGGTSFARPPAQPASYSAPGSMSMSMPGSYASPPPSAGLPYSTASPAPRPPAQSPPGVAVPSYQSPFTPVTAQQINQPRPTSFAPPPPRDPNASPYAQNMYAQPHPQPQPQTTAPGYPNLGPYHHHHQQTPPPFAPTSGYNIHNQAYRPSEAEANSHYQKYAQDAMRNRGQRPRKLEEGASRVESGVNRFLKKLEKSV